MVKHGAAQVGDDPLTGRHHEIEAKPGGDGQRGRHDDHRGERLVEKARIAAAEAVVDHVLHALAEREHAARGEDESGHRRANARAIRHQEARETRQGPGRGAHRP